MGHTAIVELRQNVQTVKDDFLRTLDISSLDRVNAQKSTLLRVLNRTSGKLIFQPFLPEKALTELNELYSRLDIYWDNRNSWNVLDNYENVRQQLQLFIELTSSHETNYSQLLFENIGNQLLSLLETDFKRNKAAQPAQVIIEPRDKKYPLHTANAKSNIGVVIHNLGPGYANNLTLQIILDSSLSIIEGGDQVGLGRLAPSVIQNHDIPVTINSSCQSVNAYICATWIDFDGSEHEEEFEFTLEAQRSDTNWDKLARSAPYSLSPISNAEGLVGRKDILNRLTGIFQEQDINSAILKGQKRVGKTSIAKVFASDLQERGYVTLYLEGGDYVDPDPEKTVAQLGRKLCHQLQRIDSKIRHLNAPEFTNSLSPLVDFIEETEEISPNIKIIFVLDEFDELPIDLYQRNPLGNAFFLTLRSLGGRRNIGFLLVGSEKMNLILDHQGSQVNKWVTISVDYFRRDRDWSDFRELIERPVNNSIDYNENALNFLYEVTAGNPYFANLVCGYIYRSAVERRDCYVTIDEVEAAVRDAAEELSANTFQHFWDDGIIDNEEYIVQKSIVRRKVLIAVADTIERECRGTIEEICKHEILRNVVSARAELDEFINRDVLVHNRSTDVVIFKVRLFDEWLRAGGVKALLAGFSILDANLRELEAEEAQRVESREILEVVDSWGLYKGQKITSDHVRAWLEQFRRPRNQRLMFKILQSLRFYSDNAIREKLKDIDKIVRRGLTHRIEAGRRKRADILVSYLDKVGKSSAHLADLYADVAQIYIDNVVEKTDLAQKLMNYESIQAVVFVDDFVGTGDSASSYLSEIDQQISSIHQHNPSLKIVFASIVAFDEGWKQVEKHVESLNSNVEIRACDILRSSDQCFSEDSYIFTDASEREVAKTVATEVGSKLEKKWPLGYGHLELPLVFGHGTPNNSLPILWSSSSSAFEWRPLFKRH